MSEKKKLDPKKVTLSDGQRNVEDVYQDQVCEMACDMCDTVLEKLREMGLMTDKLEDALENEVYTEMMAYFEKMFNYPEYSNYN